MKKNIAIYLALAALASTALAGCHSAPDSIRADEIGGRVELTSKDVIKHTMFGPRGYGPIMSALRHPDKFTFHPGSCLLVMQSGQESPDEALLAALRKTYTPIPMTGVRVTLEACLRRDPEDLNYDYNDVGTGGAPNSGRWPVLRNRSDSGYAGGKLYDAVRMIAADSGAGTVVVVWTSSDDTALPAFRAAIIDASSGYWEVLSPGTDTRGAAALSKEAKPDAYKALAAALEAKKTGLAVETTERK
jgi:hypothetical protein